MKPKKAYSYHAHISEVEAGEVGEYAMSSRRPLKIGDLVVIEVFPDFEDVREYFDHTEKYPPEYSVLARVNRFTDNGLGFLADVIMESS